MSVDPNPNPNSKQEEEEEDPKFKLQKKLLDSFPESSDEVELLSVSLDPKQQEEDPKFKSQKNLPDSFPESSDEIELLKVSDDPNPKQEEEEGEEDPKFELQKKLSDSFLESSDELEIPSVSVDPNPKQEEGEGGEEDPKFKLLKKLEDSIFEKKVMELLDHTFFLRRPKTRGSVDYPSSRGIQVEVGLPDATLENRAESPLYGELYPNIKPAYPVPNSPIYAIYTSMDKNGLLGPCNNIHKTYTNYESNYIE